MSKFVKDLVIKDISSRLDGVDDALLVNVVGLDANKTVKLRKQLREKDIHLLVVKNSFARRATAGTPLEAAFEDVGGTLAVIWGCEDVISLAKEVVSLEKDAEFGTFEARGGVMEGEALTAERVKEVSKWPNREEQLSLLIGQILSPGANLQSQLIGPGGQLASQIEQKSEEADVEADAEVEAEATDAEVETEAVAEAEA